MTRVSSPAEAEEKTRHISDLVDGIPLNLLAQAAFQCGAHARALQYYESFVRGKEGGALNPSARRNASYTDEEVTFLQVLPSPHLSSPPPIAENLRLVCCLQQSQELASNFSRGCRGEHG
jgi:hypothetical protein